MVAKKKWMNGRLSFLIGYVPSDLRKEIVKTYSDEKLTHYEIATDEQLVKDAQESLAYYYFGGGIILMGLFFAAIDYENFLYKFLPFIVIRSLFFIYAYFIPKKEKIFNRKEGVVTFPDWFFMVKPRKK